MFDPHRKAKLAAFDRLLTIMDELREKCPWDKKQTLISMRHLTIEEVYELSHAILENDLEDMKQELGDLMLHLVFYARMASEINAFDIADVLHAICDKLVHRHPHVYGDIEAKDEEQVKQNWAKLKLQEKRSHDSVLGGVPPSLPALIKAMRIQEKAKGVGFDWPDAEQVWRKVQEEQAELIQEVQQGHQAKMQEEFGDLLFALVNYARFTNINPEEALEHANKKFIKRFQYIEKCGKEEGKPILKMTLDEMEAYWQEAKMSV